MHTCPKCGSACYCSGDVEDHDTGNEFMDRCSCPCSEDDEDDGPATYKEHEDEAVQVILDGIPPEGGSCTRETFQKIVRGAFRGGAAAVFTGISADQLRMQADRYQVEPNCGPIILLDGRSYFVGDLYKRIAERIEPANSGVTGPTAALADGYGGRSGWKPKLQKGQNE